MGRRQEVKKIKNRKILCVVLMVLLLFQWIAKKEDIKKGSSGQYKEVDVEKALQYVSATLMNEKKKVALTFDDGPSTVYTGILLDGLKERNVKATFFLIGKNAEENPDLVKRIYTEGHLIGNHTYSHVEITKISDEEAMEELEKTDEIIYSITGEHVQYMRPPFGSWQKELESRLDVLPVLWTVDPLDWTTENVEEIVNKVVTETEENDMILLHDCYESSVQAALQIIDILQEENYEFVTAEELMID